MVPVWIHQALTVYLKGLTCGTCNYKGKKIALGVWIYQYEANKAAEYASAEEESKFLVAEAAGEGEKSDEGASVVNVE